MKVRIHYPLAALEWAELRLRSDAGWDESLRPKRVNRERTRFEFELDDGAPFRYFKPVLEGNGALHWSQGDNFLALRERREPLDVYPHFAPDASCHVCDAHRVPSSFEERGYEARVFLPPGYDENPLQRFPVLYLQDGQNLFFAGEAARGRAGGKHWRIAETLGVLESMCLIRPVIAVGIYPRDRMQEYTRPGYESYGRFLVEELVPWVEQHYRALEGPEHTAVMGSSLGGVVSFYLGWQYPEVFGQVGAMSATFGYRDDLLERVLSEEKRPLRIYLDSGWPRDNFEMTRSMTAALRSRGYHEGRDLLYLAFPDGRHEEESWAVRAHLPFQFFFGE